MWHIFIDRLVTRLYSRVHFAAAWVSKNPDFQTDPVGLGVVLGFVGFWVFLRSCFRLNFFAF